MNTEFTWDYLIQSSKQGACLSGLSEDITRPSFKIEAAIIEFFLY